MASQSRLTRFILVLGVVLGLGGSFAATPASATPPEQLRPGTKPWFFDAGAGWTNNLNNYTGQFKLVQELGYHFQGDARGPALGAALAEDFGNGFFTFQAGAKFWWDIQPVADLGLYIAPFGVAGIAVSTFRIDTEAFFNFQFGAQVKLVINDTWNVFVRPLAFDFFAGPFFGVRYDFVAGGVITF